MTETPDRIVAAPASRQFEGMPPEMQAILDRTEAALDSLGAAGWTYAGSGPILSEASSGTIMIGISQESASGPEAAEELEALLSDIPGWGVSVDEESEGGDAVVAEYTGQIDGFEQGVIALTAGFNTGVPAEKD